MCENQKDHAHRECVKMGFFEQRVEILGEEYLATDLAAEIIGDDALVADADALKLQKLGGCQAGQHEDEK